MKKTTNSIFGFGRRLRVSAECILLLGCSSQSSLRCYHFGDLRLATSFRDLMRRKKKFYQDILIPLGPSCMSRFSFLSFSNCFLMTDFVVFRFPEPFTMRLKSRLAQAAALLANAATTTDDIEFGT